METRFDHLRRRPPQTAKSKRARISEVGVDMTTGKGRMPRVLIVEDNRDSARTLAILLELWGHIVALAYDGPTALEVARGSHPDVVLLDIGLPGIDGYEVARRLRQ